MVSMMKPGTGQTRNPAKLGIYDGYNELPMNVSAFMGVDCTKPLGIEMMEIVAKNRK